MLLTVILYLPSKFVHEQHLKTSFATYMNLIFSLEESRKKKRLWADVPQGSVLNTLNFLLYVNNIHFDIFKDTKIAYYTDDIVI